MTVQLTYDPTDPYAVGLLFDPLDLAVDWLVDRELLRQGVERTAGEGDVRIATYSLSCGDVTVVTVSSHQGTADFSFTTDDLIEFLVETEDLVPIGCESSIVQAQLEGELSRPGFGTRDAA